MRKFLTLIITSIMFTACSTHGVKFPSFNVTEQDVANVSKGEERSSVIKRLGTPYRTAKLEDENAIVDFYTRDRVDGSLFLCQNFAVAYDVDTNQVLEKTHLNGSGPQERCNNYSQVNRNHVAQQNQVWSRMYRTISQNNNSSYEKNQNRKTCYSDMGCDLGSRCAKKKHSSQGICVEVYHLEN